MNKHLFIIAIVFSLSFGSFAPQAKAVTTMEEALARMDAIITQMQALRDEFASLAQTISSTTPAPAVLGSTSKKILGDDVRFGQTNRDIERIQRLLATDPSIYPYGVVSGYFGPKTQEAIRLFQSRFGLDTVGVVGPSTRALLEVFFAAYPDENYPSDVLQKGNPSVNSVNNTPSVAERAPVVTGTKLKSISLAVDDGEYVVTSYKKDGTRNRDLVLYPKNKEQLVGLIAKKISVTEDEVRSLLALSDVTVDIKNSTNQSDQDSAEKSIDRASAVLQEVRDAIRKAEDDGGAVASLQTRYDDARAIYKEARTALRNEEYGDAIDLAQEAEDLAKDIQRELPDTTSGTDGSIDYIDVTVNDNESEVTVVYDSGQTKEFTIEKDRRDGIITEIADRLDINESRVKNVIRFDFGEIRNIVTSVSALNGKILVRVYFDSGVDSKFTFEKDTEKDTIVSEISDALDVRKREVEAALDL